MRPFFQKQGKLGELASEFLQAKSIRLSQSTIQDYSLTLRRFVEMEGADKRISTITTREISLFIASIPGGSKNKKNAHIGLSSFWTYLVGNGLAAENLLRKVERPKPVRRVIRPFSREEIGKLLQASKTRLSIRNSSARDQAVILFLLDTGVRASELCDAKIRDLNEVGIKVFGKGSKERIVCISDQTRAAIQTYLNTRNDKSEYLFINLDGNPLKRFALTLVLRRVSISAGVNGVHPHRFRHTFAVEYLRNGGDPYTLQKLLGHADLEMVMNYLSLARDDILAAHRKASPVMNWGLNE